MKRTASKVVGVRSGGRYVEDDEEETTISSNVKPAASPTPVYVAATNSPPAHGPTPYGYFENYASAGYSPTDDGSTNILELEPQMQRSELWWNSSYQQIVAMKSSSEKYKQLQRLASDFSYVAEQYGSVIIGEYHLPSEIQSIKPSSVGGIAGGSKYFCSGVMFKFANDVQVPNGKFIYGASTRDDFLAMKSVNHDIKGCVAIMQANIPMLCTSLMSVIDYRGYRLCAQSFLPISALTLRYGSNDGGLTIHTSDNELNLKIQELAHRLNLKRHMVYSRSQQISKEIYGPFDLEGHRSSDGRFYVIDLSRLYPPEAVFDESNKHTALAFRLRPEFVAKYHRPLSSDGFSRVESDTLPQSNDEIREATLHLYNKIIPDFAAYLDREYVSNGSLKREIHRFGINMRHMGRIFRLVQNQSAKTLLLTDMVMRCVKQIIRKEWRDASERMTFSSRDVFHEILADGLNNVFYFGTDSNFEEFWESGFGPLQRAMAEKFGLQHEEYISEDNPTLLSQVNLVILFDKLKDALGFLLSERAIAAHRADIRSGLYAFLAEDVERLQPVCKHTHLVNLAGGVSLYFKAKHRFDRQADALLELALDLLQAAHSAAPFDKEVIFYLAKTYHAMLRRRAVNENSEAVSENLARKALEYYQSAMLAGWDASRCYKNKFRVCIIAAQQLHREEYFQSAASLLAEFSESVEKKADVVGFLGRLISRTEYASGPGLINLLQVANCSDTFRAILIPHLRRLDIRGAAFASSSLLSKLFASPFPWQLNEISLGHSAQVDDATVITLLANLEADKVEKVYLNDCWRLTDDALQACADKLKCVRVLNISGCSGISSTCISNVLRWDNNLQCGFPTLEVFTCTNNRQVDFAILRTLFLRPLLRKLFVDGISPASKGLDASTTIACSALIDFSCDWKMSNEFLLHLASQAPKLQSLTLGAAEEISEDTLIQIISSCEHLSSLSVGTNHNWTDRVLEALIQHGSRFSNIEINSQLFSRDALLRTSKALPKLSTISFLSRSKFFDSEMLENLTNSSQEVGSISLFRLDDDAKPRIDSANWLPSILRVGSTLTQLKFDRCKLDERNATSIFKSCSRLQAVSLFNCQYEGGGLHALVANNPDLLSLQMVNCFISSANMFEMAKHMSSTAGSLSSSLRSLYVMSCRRIVEPAVIAVLKKAPMLRKLSLQFANTTDATLRTIHQYCKYIELAEIHTASVTERTLVATLSQLPAIQSLVLKDCTETTHYVVSKILSHTSIFKLDVSSANFPRVFKNNQFGRILISQAFSSTRRSEVGRFVEESCSRWKQALVARDGVTSMEHMSQSALEAVQVECSGDQVDWKTSRAFWSFMVAWNSNFGLSAEFLMYCRTILATHGLVLRSLPFSVTSEGVLALLQAIGARDALSECKSLTISNCPHFDSASMETIASYTASLTSLDLSRNDLHVTSGVLEHFARTNSSSLIHLTLRDCMGDISKGLQSMFELCGSTLETLDIGVDIAGQKNFLFPVFPPSQGNVNSSVMDSDVLRHIAQFSGKLSTLSLRGRPSVVCSFEPLSEIIKSNTGIRTLDIRQCPGIDTKDLARVLKYTPQLETLKCAGPIEEKGLQVMSYQPYTTCLKTLFFEDMDKNLTPKYVTSLIKVATRLDSLTMFCSSIDNHQFTTVIKFVSRWRPTMKKLRLTVKKAGDVDTAALVKGCTQLQTLHKKSLSCDPAESAFLELPLRSLTLENAHQLQIGNPSAMFLENIQTLRFTNFSNISLIPPMLSGCRRLTRLVLLFCQNLSDEIVQAMSQNLRLLEHVELDGCRSITDSAIASLISGSPGIKRMSLSLCTKLSNASLIDIIRRLKDLEHLRILLTWLTPDCVSRARKSLQYCQFDYLYRDAITTKLPDIYGPYDLSNVVSQHRDMWG